MKIVLRNLHKTLLKFLFLTFFIQFILPSKVEAALPIIPASPFLYSFSSAGTVEEKSLESLSSSPYWWVNSGGQFILSDGRGGTVQGSLATTSKWRLAYSLANPVDTDEGFHPQNIFRLVTRSKWQNFKQEAYFKIIKDNLSESSNRNASNGLLLFNRYQDQYNLYYTGVRVDGSAVIKKKQNGIYTTLKQVKNIYAGTYSDSSRVSLLPKNEWIGLRSEVKNNTDGSVNIKLFLDKGWQEKWQLVAEATDTTSPIREEGFGGIRTDFMDVKFENFRFVNL